MSTPDTLPTIALAGPTASGKTAGALALAAVLGKQGRPVDVRSGYLKYATGTHMIYFRDHGDRRAGDAR